MTTREAAALLGVSMGTMERWRFEGRGPRFYRWGVRGTIVRYDRSEVARVAGERSARAGQVDAPREVLPKRRNRKGRAGGRGDVAD